MNQPVYTILAELVVTGMIIICVANAVFELVLSMPPPISRTRQLIELWWGNHSEILEDTVVP